MRALAMMPGWVPMGISHSFAPGYTDARRAGGGWLWVGHMGQRASRLGSNGRVGSAGNTRWRELNPSLTVSGF